MTAKVVVRSMVVLAMTAALAAQDAGALFELRSDFGDESAWVEEYLERAHAILVREMANPSVAPPQRIAVTLERDPAAGGVGGYATPRSLGFSSDAWPRDRYRLWIVTHELVNLFAAHYGGAGGYPGDWWADGRSPFPVYASWMVVDALGERETAAWLRTVDRDKRDQQLFWKLHEEYGFAMFARFFALIRSDGIDLAEIGAAWPAPDERRSAWTIGYLSLAAGENLAPVCREYGIGSEPGDWRQRHPEIPFREYSVSDEEVEDVMALRRHLFAAAAEGRGVELLRDAYRRGEPWRARAEPVAGRTAVATGAAAASPIEFVLQSEFGAESDWTSAFLAAASAGLYGLLGDRAPALPPRVTVGLRRDPGLGGVGGGATGDRIDLVSDQWPEEPFRLWILSSELGVLLGHHLGGAIPADCFGHGNKPFATYLSVLALEHSGRRDEAEWVRDMHRRPDHELLWRLHERSGFALFARFFELLRDDGIDFGRLGEGVDGRSRSSLYLAAYLSIAAGENLAPLFREHGIGSAPEPAPPGFEPYEISDEAVGRLIERRAELFGGEAADEGARDRFRRGVGR